VRKFKERVDVGKDVMFEHWEGGNGETGENGKENPRGLCLLTANESIIVYADSLVSTKDLLGREIGTGKGEGQGGGAVARGKEIKNEK